MQNIFCFFSKIFCRRSEREGELGEPQGPANVALGKADYLLYYLLIQATVALHVKPAGTAIKAEAETGGPGHRKERLVQLASFYAIET